jgi:hypothetical protein
LDARVIDDMDTHGDLTRRLGDIHCLDRERQPVRARGEAIVDTSVSRVSGV